VSPKTRFAVEGLVLAAVLYSVLRWLTVSWPDAWWLGYATAAVAVMLAAQGVSWTRKMLFAGGTAALSVLLFAAVSRTFLLSAADVLRNSGVVGASHVLILAFVVVQLLFLGMPLAALALFAGGQPTVLWTAPETPRDEPLGEQTEDEA